MCDNCSHLKDIGNLFKDFTLCLATDNSYDKLFVKDQFVLTDKYGTIVLTFSKKPLKDPGFELSDEEYDKSLQNPDFDDKDLKFTLDVRSFRTQMKLTAGLESIHNLISAAKEEGYSMEKHGNFECYFFHKMGELME